LPLPLLQGEVGVGGVGAWRLVWAAIPGVGFVAVVVGTVAAAAVVCRTIVWMMACSRRVVRTGAWEAAAAVVVVVDVVGVVVGLGLVPPAGVRTGSSRLLGLVGLDAAGASAAAGGGIGFPWVILALHGSREIQFAVVPGCGSG
jgi:hypothetical protein